MIDPLVGRALRFGLRSQAKRALNLSGPTGTLQVHAVGPTADRILLVIDRPSEAAGAVSQELGFAGHLARQLSLQSGRGTDLDIIANGDMTATECALALEAVGLGLYDAIALMVGASEAVRLTSEREWATNLILLLERIEERAPAGVHTFVIAVPPVEALIGFPRLFAGIVGRRIRRLNYVSRTVCLGSDRVSVLPFNIPRAPDGGRNTSADYRGWAALIAPAIHHELASNQSPFRRSIPVDEPARQSTLDQLAILDTYPSPAIDRLVESARNLFGTTGAAVTFLDHGRRWVKSAVGAGTADSARSDSFCDLAIESSGVFVVENTHQHPRLSASRGANESVRFYAGYPIESPGGHRVGVLCIMDVLPRTFGASDSALLRELALQVQSELWS